MSPLLCLMLVTAVSAVETKPVPVLRVIDGDTIEVGADLGGVQVPVRVRLAFLARLANVKAPGLVQRPDGTIATEQFVLSGGRAVAEAGLSLIVGQLKKDADGHGSVVVSLKTGTVNPGDAPLRAIILVRKEAIDAPNAADFTVQEMEIGSGWAIYSRSHGDAPAPWHDRFLAAQQAARGDLRGLWKDEVEAMATLAREHASRNDAPDERPEPKDKP